MTDHGLWVIFSHGFTSHRIGPGYLYIALSRFLNSEGIGSLRFDYTGCGESDGLFSEMTVDSMNSDLISAINHLKNTRKPGKIIILGHSLGGFISLTAAAKAAVDGLIFLAPATRPLNQISQFQNVIAGGRNDQGLYEMGPHQMDISFLHSIQRVGPIQQLLEEYHGEMLIFHGKSDGTIPVEESLYLSGMAQNKNIKADLHILEQADHHFSTVADREFLKHTILSWIKETYL